jgi:hypothetical protein
VRHRIRQLHHDGNAGELAVHVGGSEELLRRAHLAFFELDRLGAQHGVRKVEVPRVRRRVRTLGHVAQVADVALVDDLPIVLFIDPVDLHRLARIDQVEQRREGAAQIDAAPATVADVENALEFGKALLLVEKVGVFPVERMADRGFEIAFCSHVAVLLVGWVCRTARRWAERMLCTGRRQRRCPARSARVQSTSSFNALA